MMLRSMPKPTYEQLEAELCALRVERTNNLADISRVQAWLDDPKRKRAVNAFTESPERQMAYRFEQLLMGEFVCKKCGLRKNSEWPAAADF